MYNPPSRFLDEIPAGTNAQVVSVYERDRQLLEYLHGLGIQPGSSLSVASRNYDDTLTLLIKGQSVPLGKAAAAKVWAQAV